MEKLIESKFIKLTDRIDRLGANITNYISTLLFARHNNLYIKYVKEKYEYRYYNSIFVIFLFNYIDEHNKRVSANLTEEVSMNSEYCYKIYDTLCSIKCDYITYFKDHIFNKINLIYDFSKLSNTMKYTAPFDCEKTILVHLRLDDVSGRPEYDTSIATNHYKYLINTASKFSPPPGYSDYQSTLKETTIQNIINIAKEKYTDHEVIIITSPGSTHSLPYKTISSNDETYDLFLLTKCKVIIGSRSTFPLSAVFFGEHSDVYLPLWGHLILFGLDTKYDKTNITYIR
jgi:hypothetical protein